MADSSSNKAQAQTPSSGTNDPNDQVNVILNLENLVKSHITRIDRLKVELKQNNEMLEDILANDATYKEHSEKAKEANRIKANTRKEISKRSDVAQLSGKIKAMKMDIKELDTALSEYVKEYQRLSGSNEIEGEDGEVREIVYTARLVKKASKPE